MREDVMGGDVSKRSERGGPAAQRGGLLSNMAVHRLRQLARSAGLGGSDGRPPAPELPRPPESRAVSGGTPAALVSVFLPEFPHQAFPGEAHLQVLGFVAKGSFGPILKVKDVFRGNTYAVKVLPKSEILKRGMLEQSKEEVIIQRQLKHPFIHNLQDCWQTQRHLFIMCDYCGVGDLYTCWSLRRQFEEEEVRLLAAELGSALGFLHDLGIMHRDVKMENVLLDDRGHLRLSDFGLSRRLRRGGRAFTICGTIQYMAPEVLSGGPYNHAADWWSLGIVLFSLLTGEFPVPAEPDHGAMLSRVSESPYVPPRTVSSALTVLLTELLCKTPANRLRNLERFKMQSAFRGASFDPHVLRRAPLRFMLELRRHPDWAAGAARGPSPGHFGDFDCGDVLHSPSAPPDPPAALAGMELSCGADSGQFRTEGKFQLN